MEGVTKEQFDQLLSAVGAMADRLESLEKLVSSVDSSLKRIKASTEEAVEYMEERNE